MTETELCTLDVKLFGAKEATGWSVSAVSRCRPASPKLLSLSGSHSLSPQCVFPSKLDFRHKIAEQSALMRFSALVGTILAIPS
jgi:hypothetical protein